MRATTVSDLVQELMDDALVEESRTKPNGMRRRPVQMLTIDAARFVCISIYPEDFRLIGSLVDLAETRWPRPRATCRSRQGTTEFLSAMESILGFLMYRVPAGSELIGAGVSLVGTVDAERMVWVEAIRWPCIKNVDLRSIEERIGAPILLKPWLDYRAGIPAYARSGLPYGQLDVVHWGTGIGVAFANEGKIVSSRFGKFADVGHTLRGSGPGTDLPMRTPGLP